MFIILIRLSRYFRDTILIILIIRIRLSKSFRDTNNEFYRIKFQF